MSDLSDLAADVAKDLPAQVRKIIDTAIGNGWELNKPGMTIALRLNHPTDELADPVYVTWIVGRTPKGALSFRFGTCGTRGLVPLKGADLLEYLQDPTVAYMTPEDVEDADLKAKEKALEDTPPWDTQRSPEANVQAQLGGVPAEVEWTRSRAPRRPSASASPRSIAPARPLRVQAPKAR